MRQIRRHNEILYLLLEEIIHQTFVVISMVIEHLRIEKQRNRRRRARFSYIDKIPYQVMEMERLVGRYDSSCYANLRMDRNTFGRLCLLLRNIGGLRSGKFVTVEEQVAMFLSILAHHKKNRVVNHDFRRSGQTVSHYVHVVLAAVLQLHPILLVQPVPVPNDETSPRWKWFKGCLGALDGTFMSVQVPEADRGRYRTRKGQISTNVLAVCDRDMRFSYVLPGWEGSASDARILRDAVNRPSGLKVPIGNYYLCDNGYANSPGFLSPYRNVRYHLNEWGPLAGRPANWKEHYNMRYTRARNVIERAFGVIKMRWGILRSASYYPIQTQVRLIMACFLLHNFIRNEMIIDPTEAEYDATDETSDEHNDPNQEYIATVEATTEWTTHRDNLAHEMWAEFNNEA